MGEYAMARWEAISGKQSTVRGRMTRDESVVYNNTRYGSSGLFTKCAVWKWKSESETKQAQSCDGQGNCCAGKQGRGRDAVKRLRRTQNARGRRCCPTGAANKNFLSFWETKTHKWSQQQRRALKEKDSAAA